MSKIAEIVNVRGGYANFVQLRSALREEQENTDRMAMYRPTKAHRNALERICRGLYMPNDKKFYLLSGSYGTGKSHLCLMLANLLGKSGDDPSLQGFYKNYTKLDAEKGQQLKSVRKGGQFLVAVCDYGSGRKFEDEMLRAIVEACAERGLDVARHTEFAEAERRLAEWEAASEEGKGVRDFYGDFGKALEQSAPGTPVAALRAGLKKFQREAMDKFEAAYALAQGDVFKPQSGNLVAIVKELVHSEEFKEKFRGLAVFFDEFGTAVLQGSRFDTAVMQAFMEDLCQHEHNIVFVGCIHKSFKDYAEHANQTTASVMEARLTQVALANEGIEEIIGAIVETEKASPVWQAEVQPKIGVFDKLTPQCVTLNLFPWISDTARIREKVLEDIYGVHPMALHCLLRLSSEVGSDARSTFTFFSGGGAVTQPGSYADFIARNEIAGENGALRLYLADQLYEFFKKELSPSSRELLDVQRNLVNGYVASVQALRKSLSGELFDELHDERVALLRAILVFSLCNVPTTLENLQFGRYCLSSAENSRVKKLLAELEKAGALYLRRTSSTYELCATEGQDPVVLIDNHAKLDKTAKAATVAELLKQVRYGEEFLPANGWNLPFVEDKRLKRCFVRGRDLGPDLWARLAEEAAKAGAKFTTSYEGCAVYALCEDEGEIKLARDAIQSMPAGNLLVAIPHEPTPYREDLKCVLACRHLTSPEEAAKHPAQTVARIRDMLDDGVGDGYLPNISKVVQAAASGANATWYEEGGKLLVEKPPQPHKPADMLCERLYTERSRIQHVDLNLLHDDKWQKNSNTSLKQAVLQLLDTSSPVQIDKGNTDNHGEKRYLQKVLLQGCGALRQTGSDGTVNEFAVESDPDKIDAKFPVLKELVRRLDALKASESLVVSDFIREMRAAPYGGGGTMLVLVLACAVRAFGERLRIFSDSTHTEAGDLGSYEAIIRAVGDPASKLELAVREITAAQRAFVETIAMAVGASPLAQGQVRTVAETAAALKAWWAKLPSVAKVADLHPAGERLRLGLLKQALDDPGIEVFDLLLSRIPAVYAGEPVDALTMGDVATWGDAFAADAKRLEGGLVAARQAIAAAILASYGTTGDLVECEKQVKQWYEALSPDQRDPQRCDGHDDAELLLKTLLATGGGSLGKKLTGALPAAWGLGAVEQWTSLQTGAYQAKWEQAKKSIEDIKPLVSAPEVMPGALVNALGSGAWEVEDGAKIRIDIPKGAKSVIYTLGGESAEEALQKFTILEPTEVDLDLKDAVENRLQVYAVDADGNISRKVSYRIRHKRKQHQVQVETEDLFGDKGTFKFPDSSATFREVIGSITDKALERGAIDQATADSVKALLESMK